MGILESLGRSNALTSNMQNLVGTAINLRQLQNQEQQQGFTNAINMEKLRMEKAAHEREATKFSWEEKDRAAKETILDMPEPITKYLGADYQNDPARKMMFDKAKEKGLVWEAAPGVVMTTRRNAVAFKEYATQDLEWTKKLNETNMIKIGNQLSEIGMALTEESNPKRIEELTKKKDTLEKQLGVLAKSAKDIDIEFQKKLALESVKAGNKLVKGPDGTVYQRNEQGGLDVLVEGKEQDKWVDEPRTIDGKKVEGQRNERTNEWRQRASGPNININVPTPEETGSLAESMANGELSPKQLPRRGGTWNKVMADVRKQYPKFNFQKADANYNYMNNSSNLRSIGLVQAALPRVDDLQNKIGALQNSTKIPIMDRPINKLKREVGNVPVADFESLRNALISEVNTALSGSSTQTDYRIKLELENLGSDRTPAQLNTAINNLRSALEARTDASRAIPYPWEEVRTGVMLKIEASKVPPSGFEVPPSGWRYAGRLDASGAPIYIGPNGTERSARKK